MAIPILKDDDDSSDAQAAAAQAEAEAATVDPGVEHIDRIVRTGFLGGILALLLWCWAAQNIPAVDRWTNWLLSHWQRDGGGFFK